MCAGKKNKKLKFHPSIRIQSATKCQVIACVRYKKHKLFLSYKLKKKNKKPEVFKCFVLPCFFFVYGNKSGGTLPQYISFEKCYVNDVWLSIAITQTLSGNLLRKKKSIFDISLPFCLLSKQKPTKRFLVYIKKQFYQNSYFKKKKTF